MKDHFTEFKSDLQCGLDISFTIKKKKPLNHLLYISKKVQVVIFRKK